MQKKTVDIIKKTGFTLIEIMLGILIFSIVLVGGFKAYTSVLIGKVKLIESTDLQKEAFYFSEKFFEEIKRGGTIDYEEYFNRKVRGITTASGHYDTHTGFGNYGKGGNPGMAAVPDYGEGLYYCRSGNTALNKMGVEGCFNNNTLNTVDDQNAEPQRYGEYIYQFIDYNSNYDADTVLGDEDGDGNIIGDDDDEYLGEGPEAFSGTVDSEEIYLISANKDKRTFFRWHIKDDADNPIDDCNYVTGSGGCLSTIEFLKLEGRDWGFSHAKSGTGLYDGVIDTWIIDNDFSGGGDIIAGSGSTSYRQPLFGDTVNVKDVKFFLYPNKDLKLAWKDSSASTNIASYIRVQMTLTPSYKAKKGIKGEIPEIKINTTISLTEIYSR